MRVVVCGAGAVGAATAYFLAEAGADVTLVERADVACAASGKSGGFLALDWCDGQPVAGLARRSFALHEELAGRLPADWGYRRMTAYAGRETADPREGPVGWLGPVEIVQTLGGPDTTAQVIPEAFTRALAEAAVAKGARRVDGAVEGLVRGRSGAVEGVRLARRILEADRVVIAMGPWSILAAAWLPMPIIYGLKGHSMVLRTGDRLPAEALFLECEGPEGRATPEIFPRPDGTTYVCAISSQTALPMDPLDVGPDPGAFARLEAIVRRLTPALDDCPVVTRGACFRPVTADGWPLVGAVEAMPGAYVATGHSVWGILNAPATGEALAELIGTGSTAHVSLDALRPERLPPLHPGRLVTG